MISSKVIHKLSHIFREKKKKQKTPTKKKKVPMENWVFPYSSQHFA